mgnify:CR=1 FL=1
MLRSVFRAYRDAYSGLPRATWLLAGAAFVITVPGADDVMLGYQSLSFHDALYVRKALGLRPAPEFEAWLARLGMADGDGRVLPVDPATSPLLGLASGQ